MRRAVNVTAGRLPSSLKFGGCRAAIHWMKGNDCKYVVDLWQVRHLTSWLLSRWSGFMNSVGKWSADQME